MTKLQHALEFLKMGISLIPLGHRSKLPEDSLTGGTWSQYFTQVNTEYELVNWLGSGWLNYGVVCGWRNLVVIDFDSMEFFDIWKLWSESNDTEYVCDTAFKVRTSRGMHVYVMTSVPACNDKRRGIDVQAQRKFVVGPGCVHPNNTQYQAVGEMIFPVVDDIESILPLDLFPRVTRDVAVGAMEPTQITHTNTEYSYDPYQAAMFDNSEDLITKVKRATRIENFFANVRRTSADSRWLVTKCLFHDDNNPSAWIDTRRQLYGCNVCNFKPLDVINLYARMHNLNDSAAVTALANEIGIWG